MMVIERLRAYADAKGIRYNRMEKELGKANSYLTQVKNPSSEVLEMACKIYPDLSAEYLLRGTEMFPSADEPKDDRTTILMGKLMEAQKRIVELEVEIEILRKK